MGNVTVELAGATGVTIRDVLVATDAGRQPQVALALLVLSRHRPLTREELADALWPAARPPTWAAALRLVVSRVRKLLASGGLDPGLLIASDDGYRLGLPSDTVVDVEAAEASVAEAKAALPHNPALALRLAAAAAEIAARPLLPGAEGSWVNRRRGAWLALRAEALEVVADAALASGQADASVRAAERAIETDPLRESAHRRLMVALAAAGNRAEALRAYEACRRMLRTDVGVAPSAETEAVYLSLLGTLTANALVGAGQPAPGLPPPLAVLASEPIVGRDALLTRLAGYWDRAVAGRGGAVVLTGEAGIGKTLVAAVIARQAAAQGALVLYGGCTEVATRPYQPIAESVAGFVAALPPERVMTALGPMAAEVLRLDPTLALTTTPPPALPLGPDQAAARLRDAVVAWLATATRHAPVLLVLDDVHWADPPTRHLVNALARSAAGAGVLVLATQRDGDGCELADFDAHALESLPLDAIAELLPATLRERPTVAAEILARSGGNPFFAVELCRHVVDGHHGLPDTIRGVVTERTGRLPGEGAAVLARAAVIGSEFDDELVSSMAPGSSVADVLAHAAASGLIRPVAHRPGHYAFSHSCVREALLTGLSPARRVRLHRRAGEAIEGGTDCRRRVAELAHHFTEAIAVAGTAKAVNYAVLAGDQARAAAAFEPAARFYEQAVAALDRDPQPHLETRCDLLLAWGEALRRGADHRHRAVLLDAAEHARKVDDPRRLGQAALRLAVMGGPTSEPIADEEVVALATEALEGLGDGDPAMSARLSAVAAVAMCWDDDAERRERLVRHALAQARALDEPELLASVLVSFHLANWLPEHLKELTAAAHELQTVAQRHELPAARWWGTLLAVDDYITAGKPVAAAGHLERAELLAAELRQPVFVTACDQRRAGLAMITGPLDHAEQAAIAPLPTFRGPVQADVLLAHRIQLAWIRMEQGRAADVPDGSDAIRALMLLTEGRPEEARPHFERRADEFLAGRGWRIGRLTDLVTVARCAALLKDRQRAPGLYRLLAPFARRMSWALTYSAGPVDLALGMLAGAMGEIPAAVDHFADSEALSQRFAGRVWLGHTWFEWAKTIAATDPGVAAVLANRARAVADDNGQQPLADAAAALIDRLSA